MWERDETINHVISECSKLEQKGYKTRYVWMGKVLHWELCKKLKFDHTHKWYMHNPEYVIENETHKLVWDFEIKTNHQILARRPDLIITNKKQKKKKMTNRIVDFAVQADHKVEFKECKKWDKYLDLGNWKNLWIMKVTIIAILIGALSRVTKGLVQGQDDIEITRHVETVPTTALLRSARILRRVLETWADLM